MKRYLRHGALPLAAAALIMGPTAAGASAPRPEKQPMYPETYRLNKQARAELTSLGAKVIATYVRLKKHKLTGTTERYDDLPNSRHPGSTLTTLVVSRESAEGSSVRGYNGKRSMGVTLRRLPGESTMRGSQAVSVYATEGLPEPDVINQPLASLSMNQRYDLILGTMVYKLNGLFAMNIGGWVSIHGSTGGEGQVTSRQLDSVTQQLELMSETVQTNKLPTSYVIAPNVPAQVVPRFAGDVVSQP